MWAGTQEEKGPTCAESPVRKPSKNNRWFWLSAVMTFGETLGQAV